MKFKVIPILEKMKALYEMPLSNARFQKYLKLLQGETKGDLHLPIGGFNPMAKAHILQKLSELEALHIENIIQKTINKVSFPSKDNETIQVGFNLADDLKGGWTNPSTTDFDSKFKINALVERRFSTPFFWSSEDYNVELIVQRTLEYLYRTIFQLQNPRPKTLEAHLKQEVFVAQNMKLVPVSASSSTIQFVDDFYKKNKMTEDYDIIFNFFFGDTASKSLNYSTYGIDNFTGFHYARHVINK
jgi:hypothetical protein